MKRVLSLLFILVPLMACAQPDTLWTRTWGTSSAELVTSVARTPTDLYLVVGMTANQLQFVWLDDQGEIIRQHSPGSFTPEPRRLRIFANGEFELIVNTSIVQRHDSMGTLISSTEMPMFDSDSGPGWHWEYSGRALNFMASSGFVWCYDVWGYNINGPPIYWSSTGISAANHAGLPLWDAEGHGEDSKDVVQTPSGGFVVPSEYGNRVMVDVFNSNHISVSFDTLQEMSWGRQLFAVSDSGDQSIVAGHSVHPGDNASIVIQKIVGTDTSWFRECGGDGWDQVNSVLILPNGGVVGCGFTDSFEASACAVYVFRFDSSGNRMWQTLFDGSQSDFGQDMLLLEDGGYLVVGKTSSFGAGSTDMYFIRTTPDPVTNISDFIPHPSSFILSSYPNPFNPSTTLSFSLPRAGDVSVGVYDVTGRKVETLAEGKYEAGEHRVTFDGTELPSGIYFARMTAGEQQRTQKMVLLK